MKNIIITGATSFIALNFIHEIILNDVHIYAVTRPQTNKLEKLPKSEKITIIEAEMKDYRMLDIKINEKSDVLINFAWTGTRGADRDNALIQEENYKYSMDAVRAAIRLGCSSVMSAGSQAEYGLVNGEITEETLCKPVTEYGKKKLLFYTEVKKICSQNHISFKEPRFFSIYGNDDYEGTMILSMLEKMIKNEPCDLTECTQKWDFLHVKDAVKGLIKLMECNCENSVYNFGSGVSKPLKNYILEMYKIAKSTSQLNFGAIPFSESGIVSLEPNVKKLMTSCDWKPEISFEEGIREIVEKLNISKEVNRK